MPQVLEAWPEYAELTVVPTVVLPEAGKVDPIPSMTTLDVLSEDCHDSVTGSPEHTFDFETIKVSAGGVHAVSLPPPPTAR